MNCRTSSRCRRISSCGSNSPIPASPTRNCLIDTPDPLVPELVRLLPAFLARQRWYAGAGTPQVEVRSVRPLATGSTSVVLVTVDASDAGGERSATYFVPLGLRAERPRGLLDRYDLGELATPQGRRHLYDALAHPDTAVELANAVFPDQRFATSALQAGEQSNTSVVFDERTILKVFRQVHEGSNPDIEVTRALGSVGFTDVPVPIGVWADGATDLGVLRTFEPSSGSGSSLALASLRQVLEQGRDPRVARGDFAAASRELGATIARLHVALAAAFGAEPADGPGWASDMAAQLSRVSAGRLDPVRIAVIYDRLAAAQDLGQAIRIHGDLHLEQVLRGKKRWLVLDFEGEPDRPMSERRRRSSPLRDVAGMTRSYQYAASLALREHGAGRSSVGDQERLLAAAWAERNMNAFLTG
ncbi:MAG: maltokinase N-terminal cap-like domain-containing protein, partial [Actinomycetes bacterium]